MATLTTKLIVTLPVGSDMANNWLAGQAPQLESNAREQAERAAKVRFMGRANVQVQFVEATESWTYENGQGKIHRFHLQCNRDLVAWRRPR